MDQLEVFQELMKELEKEEAAAKVTEREARLRTERKHREAFHALLQERRAAGAVPLRLPWRKFVKTVAEVDPCRCCPPRHPPHFKPSFPDVNGVL